MPYEKQIFTVGRRYSVKVNFVGGPTSHFRCGEILIYARQYYSHYDNSFVYSFVAETTNVNKEWWLHEDEPAESWRQYFEPAQN